MANLKTVQVPAEVKLQVANQSQVMRNLYKDFQDIFASVDPGSAFGKSIAKAFSKVESKLSASEGLLSREFFSEADLRKVASQLSSISELFSQINIQARGVSASTLGLDTTEIDNAEKHLRQLQERVRELKKVKVGTLLGADSKELQAFAKLSSTTGFSGGKSYTENYKSMEAAIGRVTEKYGQLAIEAQEAEAALHQANEEAARAHVSLNMAEGQLANRKQVNMDIASQIMGVKVSGKGATRDSITQQYLSMLDSQLDQGQWVAGGENFAHIIAGWLEIDEADLAGTATDIVNNLKNAIRTAMVGGPVASNKLRASAKSVLGGEEAALRRDAGYTELEQKVQTSTTYMQGTEIAATEALSTLQAANNNVEQTRQLLEEIQTQMARLKELQDEYNAAVDAQYKEQINAARQGVSTAKANTKASTTNASEEASKAAGRTAQGAQENLAQIQAIREATEAQAKADAIAAKESEQFSANLKASISHWMSAQQVINMVKQGIRQAYQDIQGLDSAMTNIAVVTDMSVGDLWGKINEYMSIAQQYGVTTQGVYEVSQLYYQQGLSTNEVMEATTETLKMARIAGMGYAEAADAMTVAIRAFKLEMSDAQHITDVYSKVAAVTASDTEELAIAMSKTASSAESVGSSFENTTAMLAVMIETTRESAQNLGSALKSIISRYGEMKVGLTVDSEGEEIDYNKVDTALKSVGISIKDAQGQFRDFDDVIFELSEKWDSLDKNTQRYIATIMAGNRQQSRFIALVDNWERLDEVANAAQDSEDAGLLQYAKTLDSLETKINNIKTSFQEFYMSVLNGPVIGAALEFINKIIQGFNKLSKLTTIFNFTSLISGIKVFGSLFVNIFSQTFSNISSNWSAMLKDIGLKTKVEMRKNGREAAIQANLGAQEGQSSLPNSSKTSTLSQGRTMTSAGLMIGSMVATGIGSAVSANNQTLGATVSSIGNGLSAAGAVLSLIPGIGTGATIAVGAITTLISLLTSLPNEAEKTQEAIKKAQEKAEEANIERATKREEARNLEVTINNLRRLQEARYKSEEAEQAFIEASNSAAEQFPQLITTYDDAGNAIIDVINQSAEAEWLLIKARKEAADATETAAAAELKVALAKKRDIDTKMNNYDKDSSAAGMGNYYNNWATDMLRIFSIEDGDFAYNADNVWAPADEGLAAIFAKYESGDNSIAGGLKMLVEDLRSGALDPYLERVGYTQEDFLNYIKDYINTYNLWDNDGWGGKDIDSVLDLYGDYNLLFAEQEANSAKIEAAMRAVGQSKINSLLTAKDPTETAGWRLISGAETFLGDTVLDKADLTTADFDQEGKLTTAAQTRLDQLFLETYNGYNAFYKKLGYDLDEFNSLIQASSKGTVTKSKVTEQFEQLFGDQSTWDEEITQAYYNQIVENIEENKTRLINNLNNNRISTKWATYVVEGGEFEQILDTLPAAYYTYISDFADDIDARLKEKALTQDQANEVIVEYFNVLKQLNEQTSNLTPEQLSKAQQLLAEAAADGSLFSLSGIQTLITALQEANVNISSLGLEDFPVYTANLITEWASLQDKLTSNLTTASEAIEKAASGMELEEALKLSQKTGIDWSKFIFMDGKWYTDQISTIAEYYTNEQKRLLESIKEEEAKLLASLKTTSDPKGYTEVKEGRVSLESFVEAGGTAEVWQAIRTYWDYNNYIEWSKVDNGTDMAAYWQQYFESLGKDIEESTQKALEYYTEESAKAAEKATNIAKLAEATKNAGYDIDKITANRTIASQGLIGYSKEDIADFMRVFDWKEGEQFIFDSVTGTYNLILKQLTGISPETKNTLLATDIIDKESLSKTATESFAELYGNLGKATLESIGSLYDSIYEENQFAESGAFEEYRKAIAGEGEKTLTDLLNELKIAAKAKGIEIDESELSAKITDIQQELANDIISNIEKAMKGSLSNVELLELGEKLQLDLGQFAYQTSEGNQLNEEGLLRAAAQVNKLYGAGYNSAKKIVDVFAGSNGILGSYESVSKLIDEVSNRTGKWDEENDDVLKTLRQIQAQYMLMDTDKAFDFMNYDPLQGGADNWKTFTSNISSAMDVLKTAFEEGSKIDYTQISSILYWLQSQGDTLGDTGVKIEDFSHNLLASMDALGQVDLGAVAANLGIDISDMTGAFDSGIDELAESQVNYWTKYKEFLQGIKELQTVSNDLKIEPPKLADGKWTFDNQVFDTQIDAYESYINKLYEVFENIEVFKGENNPITQMFKSAFNVDTGTIDKDQITEQMMQQVNNLMQLFRSESFDWVANAGQFFGTDGTFNLPLFLETQITPSITTTDTDSDVTAEQLEKPRTELEQTLTSMGAEKTGDNTYTFAQDNLQVSLDISTGAINFSFVEGSITPDPEAVNKILKAAGYLSDGTITFKQDNMSIVLSPTSGTVTGDFSNITGETITESDLLKKLGITNNNDGTITFNTSSFNATIIPSSGVINSDLSNVTGKAISDEDLLAKLGIVKNESGYSFTTLDGINYNFTVGPAGIAVFDSSGISTDGISADTLLAAILAKALSGWSGTGASYTYNDGSNSTYTYKANGTSSYDISGISINSSDLAKKIEESNLNGWSGDSVNGYTYKGKTATFTYNASGKMNIVPSKTDGKTPTMGDLLAENFSKDIYNITGDETQGWNVAAKDGTTLFTIPAGIKLEPTKGSSLGMSEDGVISGLSGEVILTPNTDKIDDVLTTYEGKTINLNIGFDKGSSIRLSQNFQDTTKALFGTTEWDTLLNVKNWSFLDGSNQDLAQEAYGALVAEANALSRAKQLTQEELDLLTSLGESLEEAGVNVSKAMESLSSLAATEDTAVFTELTAFAEAFGGANLFGNLTALTSLLSAMTNPAAVSLDLAGFITQLQSMGELELDDEEINAFVDAITALTTAITALPTEVNVSVKVSAGSSYNVINGIKNALAGIKNKTVTITTQHVDSGSDENLSTTTDANYTGNVSGLALAKGNATDKLLAGAHLAGKTLVGELGPELAVYGNQYHLLGRDGAEFVDLPNDAIVFNHRQTAGIIKGQVGHRGKALVNGNVSGPAAASGIDAAIAAVDNIIKVWSNLKDATTSELINGGGGGGGGGGGNELKAVTAELQEWYNLTRQIAYLEQEINNLVAERENITDGSDYLKNLRETQKLLEQQKATQALLLDYQTQQLKRQADFINKHSIWGKYLTIDESGLLQYVDGNETNGGKGALEVLQSFNEMSGQEQQAYLKKVGYSFTDQDGKALEGSDLAQKFIEQLQEQIDQYDALYDTVHKTEETIEGINTSIEEINDEIKQNQMDLEEAIYDIIVDAWEAEIEQMQEQADLIKEANDAYIKGLQDALNMEKELYSENQSIEERESLQRQLSLLRRSGGSASEIASLEEQLDSALKDEYFRNQEDMISNIEEANEKQSELLEQQIKLQEDALEYQKENGVIWTKVYEVMARSEKEILEFMQGEHTEFFSQSLLQQEEMLTDWAMKIGIYTADQQYKNHEAFARKSIWDNGNIFNNAQLKSLSGAFNRLTPEQQQQLQEYFSSTYATSRVDGADEATATQEAINALKKKMGEYSKQQELVSGNSVKKENQPSKVNKNEPKYETRYSFIDYLGEKHDDYKTKQDAEKAARRLASQQIPLNILSSTHGSEYVNAILDTIKSYQKKVSGYSQGGLVDYTGLAMVHGSKSKPESFLSAAQTAQISEALRITNGKESLLESLRSTADKLKTLIHNISTIDKSTNQDITIAPGAVVIQVEQLADTYDIEELSNDVFNRIVTISSKATNRGVNRR